MSRLRRISWNAFCTCGILSLLLHCMGDVSSGDPAFGSTLVTVAIVMLVGLIAGCYLLLSYLVEWASKV